ncbi:unnamed protein product [Cyprideis torosa]|uniref:Actin-related protein 2/3 complex subunit 5 n=1 Tax=Cyprideis torosa TaxID=163714 RepID=A0A7R8W6T5_9CRUS|nr:unnamed protein product [Cyprideis torosa]CAG0881427.1 unnamed protein product [Cyprideis torosa]
MVLKMAKNMQNSAFRKIDVDKYFEDVDVIDEDGQGDGQTPPVCPEEKEITSLLTQGRQQDALRLLLKGAPLRSRNRSLKVRKEIKNCAAVNQCYGCPRLTGSPLTDQNTRYMDLLRERERSVLVHVTLMMRVLMSIKSAQVEDTVKGLSSDELDLLMKYIYRGFEAPSDGSSAHLLLWHEKVFERGGLGCISRVLSDKLRP